MPGESAVQQFLRFQTLLAFQQAIIHGAADLEIDLGGTPPDADTSDPGTLVPTIQGILSNLPAQILNEYLSLARYTPVGDGVTNDTAAWNAFLAAAAKGPHLINAAKYLVNGGLIRFDKPTIINASYKELNNGQFRDSLRKVKRVAVRRGANAHFCADSMGVGYGLSAPTINGYAYRFCADTGTTIQNHAVSGRGTFEMTKQVFTNLPAFGRTSADIAILIATHNDDYRSNTAKTNEKIKGELRSSFVGLFAKTCVAAADASVTAAGTWNVMDGSLFDKATLALGSTGKYTTVQNSTLTYSFTGQRIAVSCFASDGVHERVGEFNVQIDIAGGGPVFGPFQFDNTIDGISDGSYNNYLTHQEVVLTNLGAGSHTITIKKTDATGRPVYITAITTLQAPHEAAAVIVGETVRPNDTGFATLGGAIWSEGEMLITDSAIADVVAEFCDYPIAVAPINDYFDVRNVQVDNEHPTELGHAQINQSLLACVAPGTAAASPLMAIVALSGNQSIANGTQTAIAFNVDRRDDDNLHDTSANQGRLTPNRKTTVEFGGYVGFAASATGNRIVSLYKNGSLVRDIASLPNCGAGQYTVVPFSGAITLNPTDYFGIYAQQDSGGALNVLSAQTECWMKVAA